MCVGDRNVKNYIVHIAGGILKIGFSGDVDSKKRNKASKHQGKGPTAPSALEQNCSGLKTSESKKSSNSMSE